MDLALFASVSLLAIWQQRKNKEEDVFWVDETNHPVSSNTNKKPWKRSTFILVMHEPPHLFYEPKEWSNTTCLLVEEQQESSNPELAEKNKPLLSLPGGDVFAKESYEQAAIRSLQKQHEINVHSPQNCLHHLFTFPLEWKENNDTVGGIWGDFYECVSRGPLPYGSSNNGKTKSLSAFSLAELKKLTEDSPDWFSNETLYALKLYFQRQGDLRAKRRLLKGYSSADLDAYGLRSNSSIEKLVLTDMNDTQRQLAIDYTMKTDDGMAPNLLWKADVVLLGVSRAGKTPLSIYLATQCGLKVANIPLVMELPPPLQLEKVNPRKVFCLTLQPDYLMNFRQSRFRREVKNHKAGQQCSYADLVYVKRDVESARELARSKGYTEIDVTGRAMEETSALIVSKIRERFPELHVI